MTIERLVMIPLGGLPKRAPHEKQLGSGVGVHVKVKRAEVGKSLPIIARHLLYHRAFAMYYFVVRKWQHEVFMEGIQHTEGNLALVVLAVKRIASEIFQRVMKPPPHPFNPKAKATAKHQ